jgi:hypothetical protein
MAKGTAHYGRNLERSEREVSAMITHHALKAAPVHIKWHEELSVYASEAFLQSVSDDYGWLGGFDQSGMLRCVLPYTVIRKWGFRMVRFRVETIPMCDEFSSEMEESFLNSVMTYLRGLNADIVIPASTNTIFRAYPEGAVVAPYGTYVINLTQPEEVLFGNLNASHRRKVRLATKAGVTIRNGSEDIEVTYRLVRDTFGRSSLKFMPFESFKRFVTGLGTNIRIFIAEHNGVVQGCSVIPFSQHTAYYVYGGSIPCPVPGSMNLMHWEAMMRLRSLGVKRYDFVGVRLDPVKGSKQEGLKLFKERFGGKLIEGYFWKYSFNPLKFLAYNLMARLTRGGDIVDQERHKLLSRGGLVQEAPHADRAEVETCTSELP